MSSPEKLRYVPTAVHDQPEEEDVRYYQHGVQPVRRTSHTSTSHGRQPYTRAKKFDDPDDRWFSSCAEKNGSHQSILPSVSPASKLPPPRPSQKLRAEYSQSTTSPQLSTNPPTLPSQPSTPSEKRLAQIEAALQASRPSPTPSSSRLVHDGEQLVANRMGARTALRPTATRLNELKHRLPDTPSSSPRKRPRVNPREPPISDDKGGREASQSSENSPFPQFHGSPNQADAIVSPEAHTNVEEQRTLPGTPQWPEFQDDPDNPFQEHSASTARGQKELTTESISNLIDSLAVIPTHIQRLERKRKAAEKSSEIKAKKIIRLEQEILSLQEKVETLEETVGTLKARR